MKQPESPRPTAPPTRAPQASPALPSPVGSCQPRGRQPRQPHASQPKSATAQRPPAPRGVRSTATAPSRKQQNLVNPPFAAPFSTCRRKIYPPFTDSIPARSHEQGISQPPREAAQRCCRQSRRRTAATMALTDRLMVPLRTVVQCDRISSTQEGHPRVGAERACTRDSRAAKPTGHAKAIPSRRLRPPSQDHKRCRLAPRASACPQRTPATLGTAQTQSRPTRPMFAVTALARRAGIIAEAGGQHAGSPVSWSAARWDTLARRHLSRTGEAARKYEYLATQARSLRPS